MLNIGKIVACIAILLVAMISLAGTCTSGDANCQLDQEKLQLINKMGITPVKTQNQSMSDASKKISKPQPFQIPAPNSSQLGIGQDTPDEQAPVQYNPGLKISAPVEQDLQEQKVEPKMQQPIFKQPLPLLPSLPQTQTGIYR
jgi:hypothetical protein